MGEVSGPGTEERRGSSQSAAFNRVKALDISHKCSLNSLAYYTRASEVLGGDHCNKFSLPVLVPVLFLVSQGKWLPAARGLSEGSDRESLADEGLGLYLGIQIWSAPR